MTTKPPDVNGAKKTMINTSNNDEYKSKRVDHRKEGLHTSNSDPIIVCEALREQNDALRQELHDIRREMDEITDQFRTEDAEEFKQLQAELEVAGKNCRILQFKLRKSEKRNETLENEKAVLEEKIQQIILDNQRVRELDEELLVAKEVSVRLHNELEKSDESRLITEQLNLSLKQHLDTLKETLDHKLNINTNDDYHSWQLSVCLYESLFREYILMEELTWVNSKHLKNAKHLDGEDLSDLINTYQEKIAILNEQIIHLKSEHLERDKELAQVRMQNKILKQRSQSVERTSDENLTEQANRFKRGISVDGGGNLREQLEASNDEIRLLKNKLLRLEDELNNSVLEKETLLIKLDDQSKHPDLTHQIHLLIKILKENPTDEKIVNELQQVIRASSRWNKQANSDQEQVQLNLSKQTDQICNIVRQATEFLSQLQSKQTLLEQIRQHLNFDTNDTCVLLEELETMKKNFDDQSMKTNNVEKLLEQQKLINQELQQENTRLSSLNARQNQDLKHLEQLKQSILTFEKKLDQKQTRVNELSMKIIEKEDLLEVKVRECQKHRVELRELETKYYTLGKQLEEQIITMTKEMDKLKVEKEMLRFDLESIRLTQLNDRPTSARSMVEDEITRMKSECRQQILDGEIESCKLRVNQLNNEKEELLKSIRDLEKRYKELQSKYDANEQSWTRLKHDHADKQRKYDESIKLKSELQNAVDRLRQKLHDVESHAQDKQNKFTIDRQQWEIQRLEFTGKINELEEQLSKVTKRQRKDLESSWKKERMDLQKQLQTSQQTLKDMQKQMSTRETPNHLTEKINILMTENELLLNKIKDLEHIADDVQLLKTEMQRLREKNSADWAFWRKQQSDLYAQLRQQQVIKESILTKFDRLHKQVKSNDGNDRYHRDVSVGPISLNSYHNESMNKRHSSNLSDDVDLNIPSVDHDKTDMMKKTYTAQENTAASLEEMTIKIDRIEDNLFSYRRFMDFIRAKSEKGSSVVRDDSMTNIVHQTTIAMNNKRLASAPPENANQLSERRSRFDANINNSHDPLPSSSLNDHHPSTELLSDSVISPATSSKNRFFSLSRRFRFRTQSPEKSATVHFLDEDIDLETKEPRARKAEKPSKGILKTLRHRSPFRFRSKDAVIAEKEPPAPPAPAPAPKEKKAKPPSTSSNKQRGRLVELKKTPAKSSPSSSSSNGTPKKIVNVTPITEPVNASLVRRASGLKDLIHKFEATPPKPKRISLDDSSGIDTQQDETIISNPLNDDSFDNPLKTIDIPDLLQNVEKDSTLAPSSKPVLRHSNSNRLTASFDSTASMVSASESTATTGSNSRKPTSTARPLMLSHNKEEAS